LTKVDDDVSEQVTQPVPSAVRRVKPQWGWKSRNGLFTCMVCGYMFLLGWVLGWVVSYATR